MEQLQIPTFAATDNFQLQNFAKQLESFLQTEHAFVEGGLVVSLNAPFGSGKTTFLQMWANDLNERRKSNLNLPFPLILNAWESDHCGDPLLALISALTKEIPATGAQKEHVSMLREAASDVANFTLSMANNVASKFGVDPMAAGEFAEKKKKVREQSRRGNFSMLDVFEARAAALQRLKYELDALVGGKRPKGLILVDELDRCRPDYAVHYLETIKHIFDIPGLIFVLAVDKNQLRCSAKALFGADLNFDEYYRKFAHRNIELPKPTEEGLRALIEKYVTQYVKKEGGRHCMLAIERHHIQGIIEFVMASDLKPRQVQELFRIIGHVLTSSEAKQGELHWAYGVGTILLVVISMTNPSLYRAVGNQNATFEEVGSYLKDALQKPDWWLKVFCTGYLPRKTSEDSPSIYECFRKLNLLEKGMDLEKFQLSLGQIADGWGDHYWHTIPVVFVYDTIESLKSFEP